MEDWKQIATEEKNRNTEKIDTLSTLEMVRLINEEDKKVAYAVERELARIAEAIDIISVKLREGGRLIYSGCGTSGRLGVLDAAECPPTFSTDPGQVVGLIAGGKEAMFEAVEGAEDNEKLGAEDLQEIGFCDRDVLVGIAASGRTPYVIGAMRYAKSCGAPVIGVACSPGSEIEREAQVAITPTPGPEVVTGSTRMKSGTAQKMVLNMLSTGAMIKLGKVYGNLMVDVKPSNEKLIHRCQRIVSEAACVTEEEAKTVLIQCDYRPKTAIVMLLRGLGEEEARTLLERNDGKVSAAIKEE
ncbi:MAG: N-acetylmuramic acid 6-phosphate etherase [Lachnospiraceae bacterium]|nr:N-acetylmuramic acid 6-phosphate etherase [Lachnospiraceae bacterium]RKI83482.1 N-acetylmuramic acid 6-phosphate etherase [bacterium 1xD42-87]